jgi:hypothetical protein
MDFKTKLSGNTVTTFFKKYSKEENFDTNGTFEIEWQFYTEMREWGVKDISVYATNVKGFIEVNIWTDEEDRVEKIDISSDDDKWNLETENNLEFGNAITPQELLVDIETRTLTVMF